MVKLRGRPLGKWNRPHHRSGDGLEERYAHAAEHEPDLWAALDARIAALEALSDRDFSALHPADLGAWLDAYQRWDDFAALLAAALPQAAPVPPFAARHAKAFLWVHGPDAWPCVTALNPYEQLVVGGRDQLMSQPLGRGAYPRDARSSEPQLWWMPGQNYDRRAHLQLGWWSATGDRALQLAPCGPSLHPLLSHSLRPHWVPPVPGWLRARIAGWAEVSANDQPRVEGEWSPPVLLDHVSLSAVAREAWATNYFQDTPRDERIRTRSGYDVVRAVPGTIEPGIPIECVGEPGWRPPEHEAPRVLESDWTPPPLPDTAAPPAVSDHAKSWLAARVRRYGSSRTGRYWRELAEALGL